MDVENGKYSLDGFNTIYSSTIHWISKIVILPKKIMSITSRIGLQLSPHFEPILCNIHCLSCQMEWSLSGINFSWFLLERIRSIYSLNLLRKPCQFWKWKSKILSHIRWQYDQNDQWASLFEHHYLRFCFAMKKFHILLHLELMLSLFEQCGNGILFRTPVQTNFAMIALLQS